MSYTLFKTLHILGVVILVGNVTVTSVWKVLADHTRQPSIIAFAQKLVTYTDWAFTVSGVVLIIVGGYGMAWVAGLNIFDVGWLFWSQVWFYAAGFVWLLILIPIQVAQARQARQFVDGRPIPLSYRMLGWLWIAVGILSTLPLVRVLYLMVAKQ